MIETRRFPCMKISAKAVLTGAIFLSAAAACFIHSQLLRAQGREIVWTSQEKPIFEQIRTLRQLPDDTRARVTKDLALQIRQLPAGENKVQLALDLANLSTEGDFGHDTLEEVTTTLAGRFGSIQCLERKMGLRRRIWNSRSLFDTSTCRLLWMIRNSRQPRQKWKWMMSVASGLISLCQICRESHGLCEACKAKSCS